MKTVLIVQARMGSTRLPGKVLKPVLGKPLLAYQLERLRRAERVDETVVATTRSPLDQPIEDLCRSLDVPVYRGSEENVLSRYFDVATQRQADVVVRGTADCPLIDPHVVDQVVAFYLGHASQYRFVTNIGQRTFPRGMDTEVFSMDALREMVQCTTDRADLEHVTYYMEKHPDRFPHGNVAYARDESRHRWTVDTDEDFELIKNLIADLYPRIRDFTLEDCLESMKRHPDWFAINAHVQQKPA